MAEPNPEHVDLMFPNRYLKSGDLKGKDVKLTISSVGKETLQRTDGGKEPAIIVHFEEMKGRARDEAKVLVLNKTNARRIAELHGKQTASWSGKKITVYAAMVQAFGKQVEAIRVLTPEVEQKRKREKR